MASLIYNKNMILMKNIVKDGNHILREKAKPVKFPLNEKIKKISKDMLEYLLISQDKEKNKKFNLRPGVGLAGPQVGQSLQIAALLIPSYENKNDKNPFYFKGVIYNPKITRESAKRAALEAGEGCLSKKDDVPGLVPRAEKITVKYNDERGKEHLIRLKNYPAIVFQHEIDHLKGIIYYDHINTLNPWKADNITLIR